MITRKDSFSKVGFILAALGMAIGTGNLWRFPRVVTQNGGGTFVLIWIVFLFTWSIPLLIIEFSIGNKFKKGLIGAFKEGIGKQHSWMGAFVALVSTAILFYYSVVTGWCIRYFFTSLFRFQALTRSPGTMWENFSTSGQPVFYNALTLILGGSVIIFGISRGIERINKILIPALFLILLVGVLRAITLPGAIRGLEFLFSPDFSGLGDFNVWINALSQAAWSTGAGWGLILTYSIYTSKKDDPIASSATIGFGDYSAGLLAGMLVVPTLFFALKGNEDKLFSVLASGDQGLTFIAVPSLLKGISLGQIFLAMFFLALFFAAFSSLLSMLELPTRILIDTGISRKTAISLVISVSFLFGLPSALSMSFFTNQDTTWGYGLLISGALFAFFVIKFGVRNFREQLVEANSRFRVGKVFDVMVKYIIPMEFLVLIGWCLYNSARNGTLFVIIGQWLFFLILFIIFNRYLADKVK
jgi:NSS family neurotransmitter:Na+ symporter